MAVRFRLPRQLMREAAAEFASTFILLVSERVDFQLIPTGALFVIMMLHDVFALEMRKL